VASAPSLPLVAVFLPLPGSQALKIFLTLVSLVYKSPC